MASSSASGSVAPTSEMEVLQRRMGDMTRFIHEQSEWLRTQSALLASQTSRLQDMTVEGDSMRNRILMLENMLTVTEASQSRQLVALADAGEVIRQRVQMLEDRLTIAEDVIAEGDAEPNPARGNILPRP